ncbi:DUF2066 domain-containing protein [Sedimenticola hydrogenitrophicus]|uniref:DUF2066 domain-containing protein n=1 Tax=Sedimenticola hydrogenitrophicus TaxID=2967975 RepID=UPI0023AFF551|nr:DUF2066 domain-containing protein [Sedimenticola hydrogenitrophicus]
MLKSIQLLLLWLCMGYGATAMAGQVTGLYSAEVPVAGQSVEQRTDGIRRAFARMLIKVTGNRTVPQRPELQEDIAQATRYVQQFRYRLGAGGASGRLLTVQFDSAAVQRLLRERRLPVWGGNRPSGLVWLGIESQGQRRVMRPELDAALVNAMTVTADQRGVPLILPLMDLEDQAAVQVADLWGDFEQNIRRASQRYMPDLIVTGRMTQISGRLWRVTWRLYHGDRTTSWGDEGGNLVDLAREGAQHVSDLLAERYAPVGGEANLSRIRLRVSGVTALAQYAGVGRLLQSQSSVVRADMIAVEPDAVIFELQVRGGIQVLEQGLSLGGVIEPVTDLPDAPQSLVEGVDLFYRMR